MRHLILTAGLLVTAVPAFAQNVPTRTLSKADAEYPEPFTQVTGVRELKDGRVIVIDPRDKTVQAGLEQPVYYWTPDIAPAGIAFYTGKMFPAWNGNLFVASLLGRYLVRLVLDGSRVVAEERLLADLNARIRGVHEGPDGSLYVLTDGANGKILRLVRKS